MCGRVILTLSAKMIEDILKETLEIKDINLDAFEPRYNVGPGQELISVIQHKNQNRAGYMKWQFVPSYAQSEADGYQFINARSESIHEKRSFSDAFFKRRCLVLCNGFYEWQRKEKEKTPYIFEHEKSIFALAGIWNPYIQNNGQKKYGFSLITTKANELMKPIHHRMPVIIPLEKSNQWLSPSTPVDKLKSLMVPIHSGFLKSYEVSSYVNKIQHNDQKCIEHVL